jgi:hypothetical protein
MENSEISDKKQVVKVDDRGSFGRLNPPPEQLDILTVITVKTLMIKFLLFLHFDGKKVLNNSHVQCTRKISSMERRRRIV